MGIKHTKVSNVTDVANTNLVRPSDWNADHTIDGDVDFNGYQIINANLGETGSAFTALSDVPNSYAGAAGKIPTVNGSESGLEFTTPSVGGGNDIEWVTPQQYGAVANGTGQLLSSFYGDLATAQAAYDGAFYFVTSLSQTMDYVATKAAANECFGPDLERGAFIENMVLDVSGTTVTLDGVSFAVNELIGSTLFGQFISNDFIVSSPIVSNTANTVTTESALGIGTSSRYVIGHGENGNNATRNKVLYLPGGSYRFGSDTLTIRNLRSGKIQGAGRLVTELRASGIILAFDGIWYSSIKDFSMISDGNGVAAFEVDGNVPGHDYTTRGVQGVLFESLLIDGGGGDYAFTFNRQGSSGAQGDQCTFQNVHLSNADEALYWQRGFNALSNLWVSGNFQNYRKAGIKIDAGTFGVISTGFQSTHPIQQIENGRFDIECGSNGALEACPIYGCRTESVQFLNNGVAVRCDVRACVQVPAWTAWSPGTVFDPDHAQDNRRGIQVAGTELFVPLNAGTSGVVEPTWPTGGPWLNETVVDNDITWQHMPCTFIRNQTGSIDYKTVVGSGAMYGPEDPVTNTYYFQEVITADDSPYQMLERNTQLIIDAAAGNVAVRLPYYSQHRVFIKRVDTSANTVTISSDYTHEPDYNVSTIMYPMETREYLHAPYDGVGGGRSWQLVRWNQLFVYNDQGVTSSVDGERLLTFSRDPASGTSNNWLHIGDARTTGGGARPAPFISSVGNGTDIDIGLIPKGAGVVSYGTHSAIAVETVTGYITIKDAGGTVRKLAVVS